MEMKKDSKLLFDMCLAIGLAIAITGCASAGNSLKNIYPRYKITTGDRINKGEINSVMFIDDSKNIFVSYDDAYNVYSAVDGKLVYKGNEIAPLQAGYDYPDSKCFVVLNPLNFVKFDTASYSMSGVYKSKGKIFPNNCISYSNQTIAFRQLTIGENSNASISIYVGAGGSSAYTYSWDYKFKNDDEINKIYFLDVQSMKCTSVSTSENYDRIICGFDDINEKIILSKRNEGKIDVLDTKTGEVLYRIELSNTFASSSFKNRWFSTDPDGFPILTSLRYLAFDKPQFSRDGSKIQTVARYRVVNNEENKKNIETLKKYEQDIEAWKNSAKNYNVYYLTYLLAHDFFYYTERFPVAGNMYHTLYMFSTNPPSGNKYYDRYKPPNEPIPALLGKEISALRIYDSNDGSLIKLIELPYNLDKWGIDNIIPSYFFEDELNSYAMVINPESLSDDYYDIDVWNIEKNAIILTIPAKERIRFTNYNQRAITYDRENKCLITITDSSKLDHGGRIKRWKIE
jgi:hypothetical protein